MKRKSILLVLCALLLVFLTACHQHVWTAATCDFPTTCKDCGETEGSANGHTFSAATCTTAATCSSCGLVKGDPLGHNYAPATCTTPETCSVCGAERGGLAAHTYIPATCTTPETCSVCGEKQGDVSAHDYAPATCTAPATCKHCGATTGDTEPHAYTPATCTAPETCADCGATRGDPLPHTMGEAGCTERPKCTVCGTTAGNPVGHDYAKNVCTRCGDKLIKDEDDLVTYLDKNYSELVTPFGTLDDISFDFDHYGPAHYRAYDYELHINTSLYLYDMGASLMSLVCNEYYDYEDRVQTLVALIEFEREVCRVAEEAFPGAKIYGCIYEYGYQYSYIQVGYWNTQLLSFTNFEGPALSGFYDRTYLSHWRINEYLGDSFIGDYFFCDDEELLEADVIARTGYDITFS